MRTFALILGIIALATIIPSAALPWFPPGRLGYTVEDKTVAQVLPGGPAARAGLRRGDILVRAEPAVAVYAAGTDVSLFVVRDGRPMRFNMRAVAAAWSPLTTLVDVIDMLLTALAIAATCVLAVRHPSWATALLALAALSLASETSVFAVWGRVLTPESAGVARIALTDAVTLLPNWFFVIFALAFPRRMWSRTRALAAVPIIAIILAISFAPVPNWVNQATILIAFPVAFVCFAISYARAEPSDQRRLTWLMIAVGVVLATGLANEIFSWLQIGGPNAVGVRALEIVTDVAWLGIVYVVWRRNVIGVAFAINRSLVVAVITAALLGVVSLARWAGEHLLVRSGIVGIVEVAVTVLFGYGLNAFAHRLQATIERFVFRDRYAAEQRVLSTIAALPFASARSTIDQAVVNEVCDELRLSSAAIFLLDANRYVRVREANWPANAMAMIDGDDRLVRVLRAESKLLDVRDAQWRRPDLPSGDAQPVVVIPLIWRAQLTGFVMYGRHRDGSDLDPQELALLQRVVEAATVTYETTELGELRQRINVLERRLLSRSPAKRRRPRSIKLRPGSLPELLP